jgi:hypothetical protein
MPHISDLSQNKVIEGNDGEKWIVEGAVTSPDEILVTLKRLKVVEELIKE